MNRMNASNLAIVFGPTLMGANTGPNIQDAGWQVRVIDTILQNTYQIFDDDLGSRSLQGETGRAAWHLVMYNTLETGLERTSIPTVHLRAIEVMFGYCFRGLVISLGTETNVK